MRIKLVHKYLETLKKLYPEISDTLSGWQANLGNEVDLITRDQILTQTKQMIIRTCHKNGILLSCKDLELLHFVDAWSEINTLKLDAWLYNELLDEVGHSIHNMSGLEKLQHYTDNSRKICYLLK